MSYELYKVNKVGTQLTQENCLEQCLTAYKKPSVVIYKPDGWFSTFLVNDTTIVETVDIYTYQCHLCKNCMDCFHVESVKDYVLERMDMFAQCCQLYRETIPTMKEEMDKLRQFVDLYFSIQVMKLQVMEMRFMIGKLRGAVRVM